MVIQLSPCIELEDAQKQTTSERNISQQKRIPC